MALEDRAILDCQPGRAEELQHVGGRSDCQAPFLAAVVGVAAGMSDLERRVFKLEWDKQPGWHWPLTFLFLLIFYFPIWVPAIVDVTVKCLEIWKQDPWVQTIARVLFQATWSG